MAIATAHSTAEISTGSATEVKRALMMVTALFFLWGFITCLNDILIPHLKSVFTLNYAEVMLIQTFFFSAYFVFSLPSSKIIDKIGYKWTIVSGLVVMAIGALAFIPAAMAPSFPLFLVALSILAAGMTLLQVSANPYVVALGPPRTASSRLNMAGAFNSLGTTIAPYIGGLFILGAAPLTTSQLARLSAAARHMYQISQASVVKVPYVIIAIILLSYAVIMAVFKLPVIALLSKSTQSDDGPTRSILHRRHLLLGVVAIFAYVGAEVAIGSFLVNYLSQHDIGNMTEKVAAGYVTFYWGGAMIGRFLGAGITQKLRADAVLSVAALIAFLLVATSMASFGHVAMWSLILVGLFNSIMWPNIFSLALVDLRSQTNQGAGLLVAGVIGGAIIPLVQGALADHIGIHHAFILPLLCYIYIGFYGLKGCHLTRDATSAPLPAV